MTFKEYVTDWFHRLVERHENDYEWCGKVFFGMGYAEICLDEEQSFYEFLMNESDAKVIYKSLFGGDAKVEGVDEIPDTKQFLLDMFKEVGSDLILEYDFAEEMIESMAYYSSDYDVPDGFFKDLQYGGCQSGMVGMFIYNSNCNDFYVKHIDSMEDFKYEIEDELGSPLRNEQRLPHYTWLCWLCYEELAYRLANLLWEDEF